MAARSDVSGSPQPPMENSPPSSKHKRDEDMEEEDDLGKSMQDEVGEMLRATVTELEKALQVRFDAPVKRICASFYSYSSSFTPCHTLLSGGAPHPRRQRHGDKQTEGGKRPLQTAGRQGDSEQDETRPGARRKQAASDGAPRNSAAMAAGREGNQTTVRAAQG